MAKCPTCEAAFDQPHMTILKGGPKSVMWRPLMATCPACDVVLRICAV